MELAFLPLPRSCFAFVGLSDRRIALKVDEF